MRPVDGSTEAIDFFLMKIFTQLLMKLTGFVSNVGLNVVLQGML